MTAKQLSKSLKKIVQLYACGGFITRVTLMDMEFEKVKDELGLIDVNTTAVREHVAEIEQGIRLLKERSQCVVKSLPFQYLPKQIVIHMVYFVCTYPAESNRTKHPQLTNPKPRRGLKSEKEIEPYWLREDPSEIQPN